MLGCAAAGMRLLHCGAGSGWLERQGLERPGLARRRYRARRGRGAAAQPQRRAGPRPAGGAAFRAGAGPAPLEPTPLCGPRAAAAGVQSGRPAGVQTEGSTTHPGPVVPPGTPQRTRR